MQNVTKSEFYVDIKWIKFKTSGSHRFCTILGI